MTCSITLPSDPVQKCSVKSTFFICALGVGLVVVCSYLIATTLRLDSSLELSQSWIASRKPRDTSRLHMQHWTFSRCLIKVIPDLLCFSLSEGRNLLQSTKGCNSYIGKCLQLMTPFSFSENWSLLYILCLSTSLVYLY